LCWQLAGTSTIKSEKHRFDLAPGVNEPISGNAIIEGPIEKERSPLDTQAHALWLSPIHAQVALDRSNRTAGHVALPDICGRMPIPTSPC
jgi:hypothetical protein